MKNLIKGVTLVLTFVAITVFNSGCNHDKSCEAVVKVVAADGTTAVGGATVDLYATVSTQTGPVTADLKATGTTGSDGTVSFKFKLPAILDIKASKGSLTGQGIIKLEEKEKVSKTVTIQ